MANFRVFHKKVNGFTHVGVEDENGYGAIATLYPNSPHFTLECMGDAMSCMVRYLGTPDPGSGIPHPEASYDLWLESVRHQESILGDSNRTEVELYALWLIGQPPESIIE